MATFDVSTLNLPEVQAYLSEIPLKVQRRAVSHALRAGAKVLADAVRAEAPRFTGAMAESVHVEVARGSTPSSVGMVVVTGTKEELGIPERTKSGSWRGYYPVSIEFGWRPGMVALAPRRLRFSKRGWSASKVSGWSARQTELGTRMVPANPFMHRAFESSSAAALERVKEDLTAGIERIIAESAPSAASEAA